MAQLTDEQRRRMRLKQDLLGITFEFVNGESIEVSAQELYDLYEFVRELKRGR